MAYIGKEFIFEKEENYENFINALASSEEKVKSFISFKPNHTLLKNGDEYTLVLTIADKGFKKEIVFKPGVAFDEVLGQEGLKATSVVTVDGDTFTQVQDHGKGIITYKREYSANQLKTTITSSLWDGVAYRYYVPA